MVLVKRGFGVDYEEKKNSPFLESDIRRDMPGKSWKEIHYECFERFFEDEDDSTIGYDEDDGVPVQVDSYENVDDYVWPPLHFTGE